ncbi:MAG: CBS domain-containing protein [Acidobacteria bacterium]|nr:CBS domain-containing protein [Acidobacteriota bacterium]
MRSTAGTFGYTLHMLVEEVMSRSVVTLTPEQTLLEALDLLRSHRIRHLPVVDGSKVVGIVTDRDVKRATPSVLSGVDRDEYDRVLTTTKVAQFMTREPIAVTPKSGLKAAVEIFIERKVGALPVVEHDRLVGILTDIDILRAAHGLLAD